MYTLWRTAALSHFRPWPKALSSSSCGSSPRAHLTVLWPPVPSTGLTLQGPPPRFSAWIFSLASAWLVFLVASQ